MDVRGRDLIAGLPKTITITSEEIREALQDPVQSIVDAAKITLENTPPELSSDLIDRGIVMAGGGSLLRNLDKRIAEEKADAEKKGAQGEEIIARENIILYTYR